MKRSLAVLAVVVAALSSLAMAQTTDDLVFIHHSCGQNWLGQTNGNLSGALAAKDYIDEVNDIYYGDDLAPDSGRRDSLASVPGDKTDMSHWVYWFNDYLGGIKSFEAADGVNKIVMFKSCYPASDMGADGAEPGTPFFNSASASDKTIANYKAVFRHPSGWGNTYSSGGYTYKALEEVFAANPDTLFIPVTAPPLHNTATDDDNAHRARLFNEWLENEWQASYKAATGLNNVAVFDWFDVLANPDDAATWPNRLKEIYGGASGNSHPNQTANLYSTQVFASGEGNFIDAAYANYVPEPATLAVLSLGGLALLRRRRR
jgi:hypothetical protein